MELSIEGERDSGDGLKTTTVHASLRAGIRATEGKSQTPLDAIHRISDAPVREVVYTVHVDGRRNIGKSGQLGRTFLRKGCMVHAEGFNLSGRCSLTPCPICVLLSSVLHFEFSSLQQPPEKLTIVH